jgi:hypothetical protein
VRLPLTSCGYAGQSCGGESWAAPNEHLEVAGKGEEGGNSVHMD